MSEVRAELDANPEAYTDGRETIISIVQAGESICEPLAEGDVPGSSVPTEVGEVITDVTATVTP